MVNITLLNGTVLEFEQPVSGYDIAKKISVSLAKNSYAIQVNQELWDLHRLIDFDCKVELITSKSSGVLLPLLRHDMAHILAEAVLEMYPNVKFGVGPATEYGFFYDFYVDTPFKEEDLPLIENKMKEIIDKKEEIIREVVSKQEAINRFEKLGEKFKIEILNSIEDNTVTFYHQGKFSDLCRGPHSPNTSYVSKAFKLTKVSAVYWKGDVARESMQRIYGVGFLNAKDLEQYLTLQEELERNDHRKLGREMDLFHVQEEATGSVFWHEKGWKTYLALEQYMRDKQNNNGYKEIKTPQLIDRKLWEKSGHWDKYQENMFIVNAQDKAVLALKPMNCPAHIQVFNQGSRSYKDLPLKLAEFGCCHRYEPSGALHGIMRVRAFTQDDAHIFCQEDQIISETKIFCDLLKEIYNEIFGESEIIVKFSTRPEKRAGSEEIWDKAEEALFNASKIAGLDPILSQGEGAFYGPKLEFAIKDSLGREWQMGTLQVDFILPERLGANYVGEDGNKHTPVMLHRAILGSFERFIGILIEHYKGKLPLWLSPIQIAIINVSNKFDDETEKVYNIFKSNGIEALLDIRSKKMSYKVREHTLSKIPIIAVIGEKEIENNTLTLRFLGIDKQITLSIDDTISFMLEAINNKLSKIENSAIFR